MLGVLSLLFAVWLCASTAHAAALHQSEGDLGAAQQPSFATPLGLAVDHSDGDVLVIDAGVDEVQEVTISATAGQFKLKFGGFETNSLAFNANNGTVRNALRALPSIGSPNVNVSGGPGGAQPYRITFVRLRGGQDVEQLIVEDGAVPLSGGAGASVSTLTEGVNSGVKRFNPDGSPSPFSALDGNVIDARNGAGGQECATEPASCDVPTPPAEEGFAFGDAREVQVAVDNSGGLTDGNIYVTQSSKHLIDIFAETGKYLGQLTESSAGPFGEACGVTVDPAGNVYVGDFSDAIHKFTPSANPPTTADNVANFNWVDGVTGARRPCNLAAGEAGTAGAIFATTLSGAVSKVNSVTGAFEAEVASGSNTTVDVDPVGGHVFVAVRGSATKVDEYDASGASAALLSSTSLSSEPKGLGAASGGSFYVTRSGHPRVEAFGPPLVIPEVTTEPATGVGGRGATLHGTINAEGGPAATCFFQLTTAGDFAAEEFQGAEAVPCEPAGPFTGNTGQAVQARLAGLNPGTEYRFRLVAANENDNAVAPQAPSFTISTGPYPPTPPLGACPNQGFRDGPGTQLPDCRAYEQATAVDKNGGGPGGRTNYVRAAADGSKITFYSQAGVPGGRGAANFPSFLASRQAAAWSTQGTLLPQAFGTATFVLGYTPDLRYVISQATRPGTGGSLETGLFIEDTVTRSIATIVPYIPGTEQAQVFAFDGISADGSRVFFESTLPVTGETPPGQVNLYVWSRMSGVVSLAGVLPSGGAPAGGSFGGPFNWFEDEPVRGGAIGGYYVAQANAVSADGSQIYFTAGGSGELLLRTGFDTGLATTLHVNESRKTNGAGPGGADPNGPQPAIFAEATADGSKAFFLSSEELTNDANTGNADQGTDLYRYEPRGGIGGTPVLTDLTPDPGDPNGADVQGVLGISRSGAVVYFAANGVLAPGATLGNCDNSAGGADGTVRTCNLYRYDESSGAPGIEFVATVNGTGGLAGLQGNDASNWSPLSDHKIGGVGATLTGLDRTARVSANGDFLLFSSIRSLTGYESQRRKEFFRYSAASKRIDCVSCNPTGAAPASGAALSSVSINAPLGDGAQKSAIRTRNLSADGNRVFFQSADALVPGDTNGVQDVYEWEAKGAGSCASEAQNGGCLYLISTGQSSQPSYFADADESGANAFIFTASQLVPADRDRIFDIYDARELGGLASQHQVSSPACAGEACQGPAPPPPGAVAPGSSALQGPGNVKPKKQKRHKKKSSRHTRKSKAKGKNGKGKKRNGAKRNGKRGKGKTNARKGKTNARKGKRNARKGKRNARKGWRNARKGKRNARIAIASHGGAK